MILLSLALAIGTAPFSQAASKPIVSGSDSRLTAIPKDIQWSYSAKQAASKAIFALKSQLQSQLISLRNSGAVSVKQNFVEGSTITLPKGWNAYISEGRLYSLIGLNASGKQVSKTQTLPVASESLGARLVTLNSKQCSLRSFSFWDLSTWFENTCSINVPSQSEYLRAELRSWLALTDGPIDLAGFPQSQLKLCFDNNMPFKLSGTRLDCPGLSRYFGWQTTAELKLQEPQGGYKITVNPTQKTFTTEYLAPDFSKLATFARWDDKSKTVIFSDPTFKA